MRPGSGVAAVALVLGLASTASSATPQTAEAAVLVQGFAFQPPEVTIAAGGAVTWTVGSDPEQHTVTPREAGAFEGSGQLFTGDTFTVTFEEPGTVEYFCSLHPTMVGTVEVSGPSGRGPNADTDDEPRSERAATGRGDGIGRAATRPRSRARPGGRRARRLARAAPRLAEAP